MAPANERNVASNRTERVQRPKRVSARNSARSPRRAARTARLGQQEQLEEAAEALHVLHAQPAHWKSRGHAGQCACQHGRRTRTTRESDGAAHAGDGSSCRTQPAAAAAACRAGAGNSGRHSIFRIRFALPCLALPCLALPCLSFPSFGTVSPFPVVQTLTVLVLPVGAALPRRTAVGAYAGCPVTAATAADRRPGATACPARWSLCALPGRSRSPTLPAAEARSSHPSVSPARPRGSASKRLQRTRSGLPWHLRRVRTMSLAIQTVPVWWLLST